MSRRRIRYLGLSTLLALLVAVAVVSVARPEPSNVLVAPQPAAIPDDDTVRAEADLAAAGARTLGALPISFEPNQGQAAADVAFLARGAGYNLQLAPSELTLTLGDTAPAHVRMRLTDANATPEVRGLDQLPGRVNHFVGNDPAAWHADIPTFASVVYESVYSGVDLVLKGNHGALEYDFIVAPQHDPGVISLAFPDVDDVAVDVNGDLVLTVGGQSVRHRRPFIYQQIDGKQVPVAGGFVLDKPGDVGFAIAAYDRTQPLVIDPVVEFTTTLGGSGDRDEGLGIDVDLEGNVYVTGLTNSADFELTVPDPLLTGAAFAFVAKLDAAGDVLYTTYLGGGDGLEFAASIAVGDGGVAYIAGGTNSATFPTRPEAPADVAQRNHGGGFDAFITKLDNSGGLIYSTYLGGAGDDIANDIAVDDSGRAHIAGHTDSTSGIATSGSHQQAFGGGSGDAFVTRVAADGSMVEYSTYLGGLNYEKGDGIAVGAGADPDVYVLGEAVSTVAAGFPITTGAYQPTYGGYVDVFVAQLNPAAPLSHLLYSTYLGGTNEERAGDIAVDPQGDVYVTGYIEELSFAQPEVEFPTTDGAYDRTFGGGRWDSFVARLSLDGAGSDDLVYSTYLGGDSEDWAYGLAVNGSGQAHVTGYTHSTDFPSVNAAQEHDPAGSYDGFLVKVRSDGSGLVYSTHFGGAGHDGGDAVALDTAGTAYVAGSTDSGVFVEKVAAASANTIYVWRAPGLHGTPIDLAEANRLADFAVAEGIGTIFYDNWGCGDAASYNTDHCPDGLPEGAEHQAPEDLIPILQTFHAHGLQVEALYTDTGGVPGIVAYNDAVTTPDDARFDGIRLNQEIFVCGGIFEEAGPSMLDCTHPITGATVNDFDVLHNAVANAGSLPVYMSVGHTWTHTDEILRIFAGIDVQVVQNNNAGYDTQYGRAIEFLSSDEVCLGNELGKPVHVTIETQDVMSYILNDNGSPALNPFNTFFEEGEAAMKVKLGELDFAEAVLQRIPPYYPACAQPTPRGIAYHFYQESYGSPLLPKWASDADGDNVADPIDPVGGSSGAFSDGTTSGSITDLGHQHLLVADAVDPAKGIVITSRYDTNPDDQADPAPAIVAMDVGVGEDCTAPSQADPTLLTIPADAQVMVTCGSLTVDVVGGTVGAAFTATDGTVATSSLGGGNSVTFEPETATFIAPPENPDPVVVTIDGNEISVEPGQTVNVPPKVTALTGPTEPLEVDTLVEMTALFSDPGTDDAHAATWDWGDGTTTPGIVDSVAGVVAGDHAYATPGVYTAAVTLTDDQGGTDTEPFEFIVAYDPDAGFVTGGGWFDSPPGALVSDPDATGKANFGYVAKYKKGQSVPDGQTVFQFKAGDLEMHSTEYDWLVVTGNDAARFKGVGTINGEGEYKFQIWAYDDPDGIRVKIWTEDEAGAETMVYDTGEAVSLGGGNITVHTG